MFVSVLLTFAIVSTILWHLYFGKPNVRLLSDLKGKRVVITGPSKGIGSYLFLSSRRRLDLQYFPLHSYIAELSPTGMEMAYTCAKNGAHIVLASRSTDSLAVIADECTRLGAQSVKVIAVDASTTEECERLVNESVAFFPGHAIDLLILNHTWGIWEHMDFSNPRANIELLKAVTATNYFGYAAIAQFALPHMTKVTGSKLIAVSSVASLLPVSRTHVYSASKAAVNNYFTALRSQLKIAKYQSPSITIAFLGAIATSSLNSNLKESYVTANAANAKDTGDAMLIATLASREEICFPVYVWWVRLVYGIMPKSFRQIIEISGVGA